MVVNAEEKGLKIVAALGTYGACWRSLVRSREREMAVCMAIDAMPRTVILQVVREVQTFG